MQCLLLLDAVTHTGYDQCSVGLSFGVIKLSIICDRTLIWTGIQSWLSPVFGPIHPEIPAHSGLLW